MDSYLDDYLVSIGSNEQVKSITIEIDRFIRSLQKNITMNFAKSEGKKPRNINYRTSRKNKSDFNFMEVKPQKEKIHIHIIVNLNIIRDKFVHMFSIDDVSESYNKKNPNSKRKTIELYLSNKENIESFFELVEDVVLYLQEGINPITNALPPPTFSTEENLENQEKLLRLKISSPEDINVLFEQLLKESHRPKKIMSETTSYERDARLSFLLKEKYHYVCQVCDIPIDLPEGRKYVQAHHIIPLSDGGEDCLKNMICVCPNCHVKFHKGVFSWDLEKNILFDNVKHEQVELKTNHHLD